MSFFPPKSETDKMVEVIVNDQAGFAQACRDMAQKDLFLGATGTAGLPPGKLRLYFVPPSAFGFSS